MSSLCWLFCFASKNHLICAFQTNQFCVCGRGEYAGMGLLMKEFSGLVNLNTKKGLSLNSHSLKPDFIFDDIIEVRKVV